MGLWHLLRYEDRLKDAEEDFRVTLNSDISEGGFNFLHSSIINEEYI